MQGLLVVIGIIIIIVFFMKNIWDRFFPDVPSPGASKTKKKPAGEVIDITDSWIDISDLKLAKRDYLLSPKELSLFHGLIHLLNNEDYAIIPKASLSEIFLLPAETNNRMEIQRRLKERNVDFLICMESELKPILLIFTVSQNDSRREQMAKDFGFRAAQSAGINALQINIDNEQDPHQLSRQLHHAGLL